MQPAKFRGSTPIYIFECHSDAIIPWAEFRRKSSIPLQLVTFDSHTDTMLPFLRWAYKQADASGNRNAESSDYIPARVANVDFLNEESVHQAARDLWHDEHIQAAQFAGIIGDAFIVALKSPPHHPDQNSPLLHYVNGHCVHGCTKSPHDENCRVMAADLAMADEHLIPLFEEYGATKALKTDAPLALDIDLDYFLTVRSLHPDKHAFLSSLADNADVITIATEPIYVEGCRIDESITWETSLARLLELLGVDH